MVRTIVDNPSGWSRSLPGHTVEYDENYGLPWSYSSGAEVLSMGNVEDSLVFPDDDYIHFVDMVGVSPGGYSEFRIRIKLNGVSYMYGAFVGWANIPLRQNPSLQFIYGDTLSVTMTNLTAGTLYYDLLINGTKIPKPAGYAHGAF